eukprot:scaffold34630_cov185-Amphora_coffeaeformis.AAC.10
MALPPIEESPAMVVRFTKKASERLIHLCAQRWEESGLIILSRHFDKDKTILLITTTQAALEAQAERVHLMKRTSDTNVVEYFSTKEKHRFRDNSAGRHFDMEGIFTGRDRAFLTNRIFKEVAVLADGEKSNSLSFLLLSEYQAKATLNLLIDEVRGSKGSTKEHGEKSDTLWHVLTAFDLVDVVCLVHQPALRDMVVVETTLAPLWKLSPNVDLIQDYFGYEVGFYFAWLGFLTRWYFFPGALGALVFVFRLYRGDTIDTDEYTPFYGLLTFLWAVFFLRFWEREENRLAYKWGTYSLTTYERQKFFATRPEFRGYVRRSPITGEEETYYPPLRRRLTYVLSAVVTVGMLMVAFSVMILSLNLQGYINPIHNPERWNEGNHPFHFEKLADLAEGGNVFDSTSSWRSLIPVVVHVLCINILNGIYRTIAAWLTNLENHETEINHHDSFVLKRFLFEAFDCYVALFYLAFYERNVDRLRMELVSVFQIDTIRRVFLECIVPTLIQSYKQGHFILPKSWQSFTQRPATYEDILQDLDKDEYEPFDDYMEMLIQLGYVTLFASAYPLASLIAIGANWIEIRTDAMKLARLCRRPDIHRAVPEDVQDQLERRQYLRMKERDEASARLKEKKKN